MTRCSVRVLEEGSVSRCLRLPTAALRSTYWARSTDYKYDYDGPWTVRDALRRLETLIGQHLHACDSKKSPFYEVETERDVARGREVLRLTGKRSRHASFHQNVRYTDKASVLTDAEVAALRRGGWESNGQSWGMRSFKKEISYKDHGLSYWEIRNLGVEDWERLLPSRSWGELAPGHEEWQRCPTCSIAEAHKFE